MAYSVGYLKDARDWNGWSARIRTDGTITQIERSYGIPIGNATYNAAELTNLITEKSADLEDAKVVLSGTGGGQGFRDDKFLVVSGWTTELTAAEAAEAKRVRFNR